MVWSGKPTLILFVPLRRNLIDDVSSAAQAQETDTKLDQCSHFSGDLLRRTGKWDTVTVSKKVKQEASDEKETERVVDKCTFFSLSITEALLSYFCPFSIPHNPIFYPLKDISGTRRNH